MKGELDNVNHSDVSFVRFFWWDFIFPRIMIYESWNIFPSNFYSCYGTYILVVTPFSFLVDGGGLEVFFKGVSNNSVAWAQFLCNNRYLYSVFF